MVLPITSQVVQWKGGSVLLHRTNRIPKLQRLLQARTLVQGHSSESTQTKQVDIFSQLAKRREHITKNRKLISICNQ